MGRILLSEAARIDRRAITEFTVRHFGLSQTRRLRERFEAALNALAESPLAGSTRDDLDPPGHTFRYWVVMKSFIIVYETTDDGFRVARLLHGARDLAGELERDVGSVEDENG